MRIFVALSVLALAGCQTKPAENLPAPLPLADPAPVSDARIPATISHYTLGAYVDPENELIRHEAHKIQRVENAARWDLRPAPQSSPLVPLSEKNGAPSATSATVVTEAHFKEPVILAQDVELPHALESDMPSSAPVNPVVELEPAIMPNADGVIDLVAVALAADEEINPFAVRGVATDALREITLHIDGIVSGATPCVLVNGRTVVPGESVEGLTLIRIEPDSALFRYEAHRIRIPVTGKSTRIRLAL
ncbi:general secretion pathway protein GspB [Termitidicoccus mucosus]|uniref:Uncharacterized protein n=1 Tax=Termitidicoccus mucosus TaxID=1184151 RepID=A0A178IBB5_9BACT|nr:hypothetical protein AW736_24005 [Opitutaceae bacterium TSB47]